jgi:DNA helicase-2/ATP-dependent DNA helicase PcrA
MPQSAAMRRPGEPVVRRSSKWDPDIDASQDAPRFVKGERVRHARFGTGTVMELSGTGKETKVTIDFDDEEVGRKRLVVAYAGLERGWE